ncbi:putative S-adenosyl-L-methionine-dependent methyltransferase [Mycolicibacterium arabiense]|uniref:S-adenosyl-L-methionine-dependent methyltransferase n=1 Tax=Mycolicibacterium arabiense TaxID=1286181 RepID=A0A7I7S3E0_9MYCO|nr:class I SAM-dependent methyltransferase [Mycolicibacterium arabiense]MCV7374983.1 class I SAM-dependent methyltransferase [Mycolicibacterium arabiense]BBY50856.1 putative S-adenosyl-L-methionine-dependent methyltransferase [Mycolicibacterium arabiense]
MPRTEDDTWDLATSVGATATMVAAARAIATRADEPLIDDPFAEPLVRAVGVDFLTRWASGEISGADVDVDGAGWGLSHMPAAMAARTRYFDRFFADAAEAGIRQAVILAAGLDARAYRLDWPSDMVVYEIDQPQVVEFKRATLAEFGAAPTAELRVISIDLRDDWPAALRAAGFDPTAPSAWIAEGLFGYLPPEAQDRLLDAVTDLSAPGSRLGSEAVPNQAGTDLDAAREKMRAATAKWREHGFDLDFNELGFDGERNDVGEYLDARGWTSAGTPMSQLLADNGFPAIPQANDDDVTMNGVVYYTSTRR